MPVEIFIFIITISVSLTLLFLYLGIKASNRWHKENPNADINDSIIDVLNPVKIYGDYFARNDGTVWFIMALAFLVFSVVSIYEFVINI